MKRIVILVTALGVFAGACGDGDEGASTTEAPAVSEEATETEADDSTDATTADEESAPDSTEADEQAGDADAADATDGSGTPIASIDDIPRVCRELMGDFLRDIEPTVEPIDWQNVSLEEVESIGEQFEERSAEFEAAGEADGCNDLDFVGDSEFDLMVEFARDEAPGTVGFLQFISDLGNGATTFDDSSDADGFATCDDAVAFVQDVVDSYDSVNQVPAADLLKFQGLAGVMMSCTPEQLEFFDDPEIAAFFDG